MTAPNDEIYPGGFYKLMRTLERRQRPFNGVETVLPPHDVDLGQMLEQTVPPVHPDQNLQHLDEHHINHKKLELQKEFTSQPELLFLHALAIAILRRDAPAPEARALFLRIWKEHGTRLAPQLSVRWLISTATTFADHGATSDQRALGMGLSLLFDLIKLHDSERQAAGFAGDIPHDFVERAERPGLAFDMMPYSFYKGDLDRVMLARLWQLGERDKTIFPLAVRMLRLVMYDRRSVFARIASHKARAT